ncbi:MAG: type II secretion system protein [Armatimonadetes bacterium]|nr:type II secretion system protein [Armatimonadota bacterium]
MKTRRLSMGFSLVELLVVIAVIAILAAMVFPVFTRALAQANKAKCASQLKQLGLALRLYVDDWHGFMPTIAAQPTNEPLLPRLPDVVGSHAKSLELFKCPEDDTYWTVEGSSYGWVSLFNGLPTKRLKFLGQDLNQLPVMADAESWHFGGTENGGKNAVWWDGHVKFVTGS